MERSNFKERKFVKLQVVKTDGQKVDTKTMFLREIIGAVVIEGGDCRFSHVYP